MIDNVLRITELAQTIITYARRSGVILLSTCASLYSMKPILKLNVYAFIKTGNYITYKEYDFKNINYVYFDNASLLDPEIVKLELQVPIAHGTYLAYDNMLTMDGKLYTKFISIEVNNEFSKKQLFSMLDSCKYEYVFVYVSDSLMKLEYPNFETIVISSNDHRMCFDIHHKRLMIGVWSNEYGEMMSIDLRCILKDKFISFDNMCFRRNVQSSNDLRNLMQSGKQVDILHTPSTTISSATYTVRSRIIYINLETDTLYVGKNILCKNISLIIYSRQAFVNVIIDNDCEYSFRTQIHRHNDRYPLKILSDGTNLLAQLRNNSIVLINSTKYVPLKHYEKLAYDINYIDEDITKDNHRDIIRKYLYNDRHIIISDQEHGITNNSHVHTCGWSGDIIKICDIDTPQYVLYLINDNSLKQLIIINISDSRIHNSLNIIITGEYFCDEMTLMINTIHGISNIPNIVIECVDIAKLTVSICDKVTTVCRNTIDVDMTVYGSIIQ